MRINNSSGFVSAINLLGERNKFKTIEKLKEASASIAASLSNGTTAATTAPPPPPAAVGTKNIGTTCEWRGSIEIVICDTVLEEETIEALVDLIQQSTKRKSSGVLPLPSTAIRFVDCSAVYLERPGIRSVLAKALGRCQQVYFSESPIFLSESFLGAFLASADGLNCLRITHSFQTEEILALVHALIHRGTLLFNGDHDKNTNKVLLQTLDLGLSQFQKSSDLAILGIVLGSNLVKELNLRYMRLEDDHLDALLSAINDPTSLQQPASVEACSSRPFSALQSLNLSGNRLSNRHPANRLGDFLGHRDCNLQSLFLGHQSLRRGVSFCLSNIAEGLKTNTTLKSLFLQGNRLKDRDAILLAETVLGKNSALRDLSVASNEISDVGIQALAEAAAGTKQLECLGVEGNPMGRKGLLALLAAVSEASSIVHVGLSLNDGRVHDGETASIQRAIRYRAALNRGTRGLLSSRAETMFPLALWPLAMESSQLAANNKRFPNPDVQQVFCISDDDDEDFSNDVLYCLVRENSGLIFDSIE